MNSIVGRMRRADLLKLWNIFHGKVCSELVEIFDRQYHGATRGHIFKIAFPRSRTDVRRRFLNARMVQIWNALPAYAVQMDSVERFKTFLDGNMSESFYSTQV